MMKLNLTDSQIQTLLMILDGPAKDPDAPDSNPWNIKVDTLHKTINRQWMQQRKLT
jgi:hypothetical protein